MKTNCINTITVSCICLGFSLIGFSCSSDEKGGAESAREQVLRQEVFVPGGEAIELAGVKTGRLEYRIISPIISCTGELSVPPQGRASVSAQMGGYLLESRFVQGNRVAKGQVLARMSSPDYISLQQDYLETKSELDYATQEFRRQEELGEQNATALKRLQESESVFNRLSGKLAGLTARLQLLGVEVQNLGAANIESTLSLRAPISGIITTVTHHTGQFADAKEVLFEMVDGKELQLELHVFEQDVHKISKGQAVSFRPAGSERSYAGQIALVNSSRNPEDRTFTVLGKIEYKDENLRPGMFVEADILLSRDMVASLPEGAIIQRNNLSYLITEEKGVYTIRQVETAHKAGGWVAIRDADGLQNREIVVEGAARLFAALERAKD